MILRDPYKRCISAINHLSYSGQVKPYKTVEGFINNVDETLLYQLIEFSNYPRILKQIKEYDVDHQFCILSFEEDICKRPDLAFNTVASFLKTSTDLRPLKLSSAKKNKKVSPAICKLNSKLLKFKKLRKLTQLAHDVLRLKPYEVEQDPIKHMDFKQTIYNWDQYGQKSLLIDGN